MPILGDDEIRDDSIIEVRVEGKFLDQDCTNVFHYRAFANGNPAPPSPPTLSGWLTTFQSQWQANIIPHLVDAYQVINYRALKPASVSAVVGADGKTRYNVTYVYQELLPGNLGDVGGLAGNSEVSFAAVSGAKFTGLMNPNARGGVRLPATTKDAVDDNKWDGTETIALGAGFDVMVAPVESEAASDVDMKMVVFSRSSAALAPPIQPVTLHTEDVRRVIIDQFCSSQVSRKVGRGR